MSEPLTPEELETYRRMTFEPYDVSRLFATIDSLSQDLKAAREETVPLLSHNAWLRERLPEWAERTHAAEAEVSRLRAALKDLQAGTPTSSTGLHALIAAALTEPEEGES